MVITNNAHIRELNHLYRGIDATTNVLSFSMLEGEFGSITNLLGDLVISAERAQEEAYQYKITTDERLSQLLVHGILHLVGYDHSDDELHYLSSDSKETGCNDMVVKSLELLRLIEPNTNLDFF